MNSAKIEIDHNGSTYTVVAAESFKISQSRSLMPAKATFEVVRDENTDFTEGDTVRIYINDKGMFWGRVFTKNRDKKEIITVTAYDQTRYLKNKGIYSFSGKNISEIVKTISGDWALTTGEIENSPYIVSDMLADEKTLFDIIGTGIDETYENTGELFILYDDFGKLALKNGKNMEADYLLCNASAENFSYSTSIDKDVYNSVELTKKDKKNGDKQYFKKDDGLISLWGNLRFSSNITDDEDGNLKAEKLLSLYGQKKRNLSISGAFGDTSVRAGSTIYVNLGSLADITIDEKMLVEEAEHVFSKGTYKINLTLRGGIINA